MRPREAGAPGAGSDVRPFPDVPAGDHTPPRHPHPCVVRIDAPRAPPGPVRPPPCRTGPRGADPHPNRRPGLRRPRGCAPDHDGKWSAKRRRSPEAPGNRENGPSRRQRPRGPGVAEPRPPPARARMAPRPSIRRRVPDSHRRGRLEPASTPLAEAAARAFAAKSARRRELARRPIEEKVRIPVEPRAAP